MEDWQKQFIIKNLPELIGMTKFNAKVKAKLQANHILSQDDVKELDAYCDHKGKAAVSSIYYKCLMTRVGAYNVLARILEETDQVGAVRMLNEGLQKFGFPEALEVFNNVEINVQGKTWKFNEFFDNEKLELAQQIFRETISDLDMYDSFVKKEQTFVLATSSIPPEPPFYIPRLLSNRIEVNESIFKADIPDIFVFKNTIPRPHLSEMAKPNSTDTSTSQLTEITCRFIYLDEFEDWYELKKSAKVPIHLINSDTSQQIYLLEDTTAIFDGTNIHVSEDEFVQQQLSEKVSSVCICDTPGMGKSFLLANIARKMSKHCTGTIIVFIQLSTFVADLSLTSTNTTQDDAFLNLFKDVSPARNYADLLLKLLKADLLEVEIFFDGFDEIPSSKVEFMTQFFLLTQSKLQNVRMYITSRPHMRRELEKSLDAIAYDIMPFNMQNQVDYLVQFWSPSLPQLDQEIISNYAQYCLKEINKTLTRNDNEMAGNPLLCRLIAEVYASKVHLYSTTGTKNIEFPLKIAAMYQQFVELRIKACTQNEDEFKKIKLIHVSYALKQIFPTKGFCNDKIFTTFNQMMESNEFLKAGIIQLQPNAKLEFIHRTFAEYFSAEYFSEKLQSTASRPKSLVHKIFNTNDEITDIFSSIFNFPVDTYFNNFYHITFLQSVMLSFLDFSLIEVRISDEMTSRLASYCASSNYSKLFFTLCACCNQNLYRLFSVLTKAVTTWNKDQKEKHFTSLACLYLLSACIKHSTSLIFRSCAKFVTEVLNFDLDKIDTLNTLLPMAAEAANDKAVEYLVNRVSIQPYVLETCVKQSYYNDMDMIRKKENVLQLLRNKNSKLFQETPDVLAASGIQLGLFKILVKFGSNLTAVNYFCMNCAMVAALYMSSSDFNELVQFLLNDCKAEYLFLDHEKWRDPLPYIIKQGKLLPETLELLLSIPRMNINMIDWKSENLLFSAVDGNNVNNVQLLVNRGLDHKKLGWRNKSLLHAAPIGKLEMIYYLLSLGMDPNCCDDYQCTPLHYAVIDNVLSVVEVLVENGANVHAKNITGQTAIHLAAQNDNFGSEIIKYLIEKGVGVNDCDDDGNTPLHLCKYQKHINVLIKMGADIHAKNKKGETSTQLIANMSK